MTTLLISLHLVYVYSTPPFNALYIGIINNTLDTIFTYRPGDSWSEFYDPAFVPVYEPVFNDSTLENEAKSVCGDDVFCLFDIATTKRVDIGASTMEDSQGFDNIVELSKPSKGRY